MLSAVGVSLLSSVAMVFLAGLCYFGTAKNPILAFHAKIIIFAITHKHPNPDIVMVDLRIRYRS